MNTALNPPPQPALNQDHLLAMRLLAEVYLEQQQGARAIAILRTLRVLWPEDTGAIKQLAYSYLETGEYAHALAEVKAFRQLTPLTQDNIAILLVQGRALSGLGRQADARQVIATYLKHQTPIS